MSCSGACSNYTELKDTWRGIDENNSLSRCDQDWLKQGWYKLMLRGNVANLVLTAPPLKSCGTDYPIWFNGKQTRAIILSAMSTHDGYNYMNNDVTKPNENE